MQQHLTHYQRSLAHRRMFFDTDFLSSDLAEALRRATTGSIDNNKSETGVLDFLCGLYLHYRDTLAVHFRGDFKAFVQRKFPIHRFGREGLLPKSVLDQMAAMEGEGGQEGGCLTPLSYTDELLRLLWLSARLANAVGDKASLKDVIAAIALDQQTANELLKDGIESSRVLADFDREIGTVMFYTSHNTGEGWPKKVESEFERGSVLQSPFVLQMNTPSGPFQPVHSGRVRINGQEVASVAWPERPIARVEVSLNQKNRIELELEGGRFGSADVTVRGTLR